MPAYGRPAPGEKPIESAAVEQVRPQQKLFCFGRLDAVATNVLLVLLVLFERLNPQSARVYLLELRIPKRTLVAPTSERGRCTPERRAVASGQGSLVNVDADA